jgi:cysteine desulfurase
MLLGGGQELGYRSGTENIPGIAGFALAAERSCQKLQEEASRLELLRRQLEDMLLSVCPDLEIAGKGMPRSSILCCRFPGIAAEEMVSRLDLRGICVSPGAACAARSHSPSHVLLSMGYSPKEAAEFVRFSPGRNTTQEEILKTVDVITSIIKNRS